MPLAVRLFRLVSFLEGCSYLLLLFVAMPLKYLLDQPQAVKVLGRVHGLLFVLYLLALVAAHIGADWRLMRSLRAFLLSIVPFGFLWVERELRRELVVPAQGTEAEHVQ